MATFLSPTGSGDFLVARGSGDFPVAHWEWRLSCRPLGVATFLSPTGSGDFLVAHWEWRLSCRPLGVATFLSPTGSGDFPVARVSISCRPRSTSRDFPVARRRLSCRPLGVATFLSPAWSGDFPVATLEPLVQLSPTMGVATCRPGGGSGDWEWRLSCRLLRTVQGGLPVPSSPQSATRKSPLHPPNRRQESRRSIPPIGGKKAAAPCGRRSV